MSVTEESPSVVVARRYYHLVDANDVSGLVELFAPDATYHRPGYPPLVGRADLDRFYRNERVIREGRHTLTHVVVAGLDAAVQGEFRGVLRDGREVSLRFADFFRLTSGHEIARRDTFFFAPMV